MILVMISCVTISKTSFVKVGDKSNKIYLQVLLTNNQKNDTIYFNLHRLNLHCNYPQNIDYNLINKRDVKKYNGSNFIIENQSGEFRFFNDLKAINSLESFTSIDGPIIDSYIFHCDTTQVYIHRPKETFFIDYIQLDKRLLKINISDKKVRLWYLDSHQDKPIISNWINL